MSALPETGDREALLDAAIREIGTYGFHGAPVGAIARGAGLTRADFHACFASKEDCLLEAWDGLMADFSTRAMAGFSREERWVDQMRAAAAEIAAFLQSSPEAARVLFVELPHAGPRAAPRRELASRSLTAMIDRGRQELDDPGSVAATVSRSIAGSIYTTIRESVVQGWENEGLMRELLCLALMPYLGVEAALKELEPKTALASA